MLGFRTDEYKFGISAPWLPLTSDIDLTHKQLEFYDYSTTRGQMELDNSLSDPRVQPTLTALVTNIIPNELQQTLPGTLAAEQAVSKARHLADRAILENFNPQSSGNPPLADILGYGAPF